MNTNERLKQLREELELSQAKFAQKAGLAPTTLNNIELNRGRITPEIAKKIEDVFGVNLRWLLLDENPKFINKKNIEEIPDEDKLKVPLDYENTGSCGCGAFINDLSCPDYIYLSRFWIKNILRASIQDLMIIFANGDSMEDTIQDGDMLLVDKTQREPRNGVYLIRFHNELFVKRIQILHKVALKSDNPHYDPIEIETSDLDSIQIIGKVIWNGSKKNI